MARVTIVPTRSHHDATDTAGLYRGERFHLNLYEKARMVYNAQLGVTIDKLEQALKPIQPKDTMPDDIVPGRNRYAAQCLVYEYNLSKAYD